MEILKTQLIISTIVLAIAAVALIVLLVLYIRKAKRLDHAMFILCLLLDEDQEDPFEEFKTGGDDDKRTVQKVMSHISTRTQCILCGNNLVNRGDKVENLDFGEIEYSKSRGGYYIFFHSACYRKEVRK